jgi:hypothetical protein
MGVRLIRTWVATANAQPSQKACTSPILASITLWYWYGGIHASALPPTWINDASLEETSIDTFVQLASHHSSGLIAIVRSQEARLSGFKN